MTNLPAKQEYSSEQLTLIKSTVAKGATDDELKLFLYRCKNMGLDPLKPGQVHFVKYGSNPGSIVVGIDGMRAKAIRTGQFAGIQRGVIKDGSKIIAGWCEVRRKDFPHPIREEVPFDEYNTGKAQWVTKPETMIKKVAEAAALRMAFPDDVGGMYSEDETSDTKVVRDAKTQELTEEIQATKEAPEFEAASYFDGEPEPPAETPQIGEIGDSLFTVGKKHKGKMLKAIPLRDLAEFLDWARGQGEVADDVMECVARVESFLKSAQFRGKKNAEE